MSTFPGPFVCSICRAECNGWSHNAQPINDGRCCGDCNDGVVIPIRMARIMGRQFKKVINPEK